MYKMSIRIKDNDPVNKEDINKLADQLDINKTDVVILALEIIKDFSPNFIEAVEDRAIQFGLPIGIVIRNLIAKQMGENAGEWEFWQNEFNQKPPQKTLYEFAITNEGPISDQEVFENAMKLKYQELIEEYIEVIHQKAEYEDLTEEEKDFLKNHK